MNVGLYFIIVMRSGDSSIIITILKQLTTLVHIVK